MNEISQNEYPYEWITKKFEELGISNVSADFKMSQNIVKKINELKQHNDEANHIIDDSLNEAKRIYDNEITIDHPTILLPSLQIHFGCNELSPKTLNDMETIMQKDESLTEEVDDVNTVTRLNETVAESSVLADTAYANVLKEQLTHASIMIHNITQRLNNDILDYEKRKLQQQEITDKSSKQLELKNLKAEQESLEEQYGALEEELKLLQRTEALGEELDRRLARLAEQKVANAELQNNEAVYHGLPCDISLAKLTVREKRKELENLKGEIAFLVGTIASDF